VRGAGEGGREYGRGRGRGNGSRGGGGVRAWSRFPRAPQHARTSRTRHGVWTGSTTVTCRSTDQAAELIRPRPRARGGAGERARLGGPHPRASDRADGVLVKVDEAGHGDARRRLVAHLRSGGRPSSPPCLGRAAFEASRPVRPSSGSTPRRAPHLPNHTRRPNHARRRGGAAGGPRNLHARDVLGAGVARRDGRQHRQRLAQSPVLVRPARVLAPARPQRVLPPRSPVQVQ
jgi:hypothetical protein